MKQWLGVPDTKRGEGIADSSEGSSGAITRGPSLGGEGTFLCLKSEKKWINGQVGVGI